MKGFHKLILIAVVAGVMAVPVQAGSDITVSGQVRLREQLDDKSFDTAGAANQFADMRTRVGVAATVDDNAHAFVQFQDSRVAGANSLSGTLNDGKNVDLHQAFIQIDNIFGEGWGGKAGRFEFSHGNERVFGPVGWDNVGRAWEGIMFWNDRPDFRVTAFSLKALELQSSAYNRDFDIFGLYGNIRAMDNCKLNLFGFYEYDADTNFYAAGINKLNRINLGLYYQRNYQQFDFELNGVYQTGKQPFGMAGVDTTVWGNPHLPDSVTIDMTTVSSELDISAFMFTFEAGYTFQAPGSLRLAVGVDYTSGDDNPSDDKYKAYNNLYYTGHKFRGYMDYFVNWGKPGLKDFMVRGRVEPLSGWIVNCDLHFFDAHQKYPDRLDTLRVTKRIGTEIDLTVSTTRVAGVNLTAGASVFLPDESFAGIKNPDPGFWAWSMATLNFGK